MLIGLETEYSSFCRDLKHTLNVLSHASASLNDDMKNILEQHDRSLLVGKIPKSLFSDSIPQPMKKARGAVV